MKMSLLSSNLDNNEGSRKQKHVIIKTESLDNSKLKTLVYYDAKPTTKTALLQEYKTAGNQMRPATLHLKGDRTSKSRLRSKSIDNPQRKIARQVSATLTDKLKEKFLHSSPDLNDNASDNESTPLVSSSTKTSNSLPLSPLSVASITPDKENCSLYTDEAHKNVSLSNLSGPESISDLLSPDIKPRLRSMSDCGDGIGLLSDSKGIGESNASIYSQGSHGGLQLLRQDAVETEENANNVDIQ